MYDLDEYRYYEISKYLSSSKNYIYDLYVKLYISSTSKVKKLYVLGKNILFL